MRSFGQAVGMVLELVGVSILTGVAIKAECDRHRAVVKLHQREFELACVEIHEAVLEAENKHLKEQLKKHESKKEEAEA